MSPRTLLVALAAAGCAYAQVSRCDQRDKNYVIENSGDASALASCVTWRGNIEISEKVSGALNINSVRKIEGDLIIKNVKDLQSFGADSLSEITGDWTMSDVTKVVQINTPNLKTVGGTVSWNALSGIQSVSVGPITKVKSLLVRNTRLQNLDSFNLVSVARYEITNNDQLQVIKAQLGNVSESLIIEGNVQQPSVSFPNLVWAQEMSFTNCSAIELPSLANLNGSLALKGNTLESFSTPNLTDVGSAFVGGGGSLTFSDNQNLSNVSMPLLKRIGGTFQVAKNPKLAEINQFPKLTNVIGALDFFGDMTKISLPSLAGVDGTFNIQSTQDILSDCGAFQKLKDNKKIIAKYVCRGKEVKPGDVNTAPAGTTTGGNGGDKKSSASGLAVSVPMVMGAALVAALF